LFLRDPLTHCAVLVIANSRLSGTMQYIPKPECFGMPYYTFDLVLDEEFKNQGTIILENLDVASERADQLAIELSQVRPELKARGCAVRVADVDNTELYRTPLDPVPSWMRRRHSAA
jgi:hypothetical protein